MKKVLVTGASSGIGKDIARRMLRDGHTVYVAARRMEKMADLLEQGAVALSMDITKQEDIQAVADRIAADCGGVDVLVNNAGFGLYGAVEDVPIDDARYQFEVNLFGPARLTQLMLPFMREQHSGTIVNISSMGGKMYTPLGAWYHATKHALEGWSDCLRLELSQFGIDVVIIEPGVIDTEFGDVLAGPLLEMSGDGPYSEFAGRNAARMRKSYKPGAGTPGTVVADVVARAVGSKHPRTRYVAGKFARPAMWTRKFLGDRVFDWAITRT